VKEQGSQCESLRYGGLPQELCEFEFERAGERSEAEIQARGGKGEHWSLREDVEQPVKEKENDQIVETQRKEKRWFEI